MAPDHMDDPFLDSEDEQEGGQGAPLPSGPAGGAQQLPLALGKHLKGATTTCLRSSAHAC